MIWAITGRQIVYKLVKKRRVLSKSRKKENGVYYSSNYSDYLRMNFGIKEDEFIHILFNEEFNSYRFRWLKNLYIKLRPVYFENFHSDLKDIIKSCISKGYIERNSNQDGIFIKDTPDGRKLLSIWYFPKKLIELVKILKIAAIAFAELEILKKLF